MFFHKFLNKRSCMYIEYKQMETIDRLGNNIEEVELKTIYPLINGEPINGYFPQCYPYNTEMYVLFSKYCSK